ncbi:MAG: tRNA (guanosine(37)-N1)-methyltransferase TrmD [Candidatus Beckwithbacteria bacterium]|nr:tRNA (guanosine(37)-N1)-methyltransferase TrmD [Candidatus Beckwithbacteria bacterium]
MQVEILTIFPEIFPTWLTTSIIGRAQKKKLVKINVHNLRDWATDKHKSVDDKPFGGGPGMVMRVDVVERAISEFRFQNSDFRTILLTPQGKKFNQRLAQKLAKQKQLILICGHYEGFDERIRRLANEEISIGDYVLTGGEIPAMALIDAVVRLIPGVVGNDESTKDESFSQNLLEYPQYTRPEIYKKMTVPKILLSGNHAEIKKWRKKEAEKRTKQRRPDLLK